MNLSRILLALTASCFIYLPITHAQDQPIGSWRSFMSYNSAFGVATDGNKAFVITEKAFYTYDNANNDVEGFSKVEGMSDIGMKCIGYDMATSTAVLVYANGNIDLFKNNTFYNVPDLKIKTIAGAKEVYSVYILNGNAYLSTSLGVVVVNIDKQNIRETYEFNVNNQVMPVKGIWTLGDSLYAITGNGLYRAASASNELQNFQVWEQLDTVKDYNSVAGYNGELYISTLKTVYRVANGKAMQVYHSPFGVMHLDPGNNHLLISEYDTATFSGSIKMYTAASGIYDSTVLRGHKPAQATRRLDGILLIADEFGGMLKEFENRTLTYIAPAGPTDPNSYDIYAYNKEVWIAHGGFTEQFRLAKNDAGLSNYKDGNWKYYKGGSYPAFNGLNDFSVFLKDEKSGTLYAGSFNDGLYIINPDGTGKLYDATNVFDNSIALGPGDAQIAGLGLDSYGNLWVSTMFSPVNQLYVRTTDSIWQKFSVPGAQFGGPLVVDDDDQVWFAGYSGGGVSVYNFNGTPTDKSDDASYHLSTGKGYGNLPSNTVNCLAKDKNNNIWIGTANGIGIVSNCLFPFNQTPPCDAEIPIVQYDQYAGFLFAGNNVKSIAVDGANRKWVGTDDGVWLLSPDAGKIVYRFTTENSPLPSNRIQKISIDHITGDVFIGTEQGLVSYRSTATEGGTANGRIVSFPNPVPFGYTGTVAIKGLVANADVRITDISGQLVYRTKALGGQAVWNGLDYTGRRPQSGVYLIFASDNNGEETYTGKLVLLK